MNARNRREARGRDVLVNAWRVFVVDRDRLDDELPTWWLTCPDPKALWAQMRAALPAGAPRRCERGSSGAWVVTDMGADELRAAMPSARVRRARASELPAHVLLHLLTCRCVEAGEVPSASTWSGQTYVTVTARSSGGRVDQVVALSPTWSDGAQTLARDDVAIMTMPVVTFTAARLRAGFAAVTPDGRRARDVEGLQRWRVDELNRLAHADGAPLDQCLVMRALRSRRNTVDWLRLSRIGEEHDEGDVFEGMEGVMSSKAGIMARVMGAVSDAFSDVVEVRQETIRESRGVDLAQESPSGTFIRRFPGRMGRHGFRVLQILDLTRDASARAGLERLAGRSRRLGLPVVELSCEGDRDPGQPLVVAVPDLRGSEADQYRRCSSSPVQHANPAFLAVLGRGGKLADAKADRIIGELMIKDDVIKGRSLTFDWRPSECMRLWAPFGTKRDLTVAWVDLDTDGALGFGSMRADDPSALASDDPCVMRLISPDADDVEYCLSIGPDALAVEETGLSPCPDVKGLVAGLKSDPVRATSKSRDNALMDYRYDIMVIDLPDGRVAYRVGDRHGLSGLSQSVAQHYRAVTPLRGDARALDRLLGSMDVDVVRGSMATVRPFVLKHLREWLLMRDESAR